ncbi:MAG: hypothetical protein E4H07_09595 [Nitrosomonadales bacterium]|nr:MAG: hypothetical protein E4H07_09595 [Nitrosomonadales bacterium]
MTYLGPFTQATLMYEPNEVALKGGVTTPGTILDYVAKNQSHFLHIIMKAGLQSFYNSIGRSYTLFVSRESQIISHLDKGTSIRFLKMSTVPGVITTDMFSNNQTIFPLDHRNDLSIKKYRDGEIRVDDNPLIAGDIMCKNGIIHIIDGVLWPTY